MNKSIIFPKAGCAEIIDEDIRQPAENEVLVKTAVSTISSGTERANLRGDINVSVFTRYTIAQFPRRSGYSSSGTVISVGDNVRDIKAGDRVAMAWSTHSQFNCIDKSNVYKIPYDSISFEEAALLHIGTFPMAALRKCRLEIGESAIVMGLGVLGRMAVMQLHAAGAAPVIAIDPVKEKREQALIYGADYAFDSDDADFAEKVKGVTNGGVNVAIEVTGSGKALDQVLDCMASFGRVALLGCTRNSDFTIDYYHKVHGPGISLIGAHTNARPKNDSSNGLWTQRDDIIAQMRLIHYGRLDLSSLIEETHSPSEAEKVYNRLLSEKSFPLVQFDWRDFK